MRRFSLHSPAAALWLVLLFALGAGVLPPLHRAQHAEHAAQTGDAQTGDVDSGCDLCAATLAAPLPAAVPVVASVVGTVVAPAVAARLAMPADVTAAGRGPPAA